MEEFFAYRPGARVGLFGEIKRDGGFRRVNSSPEKVRPHVPRHEPEIDVRVYCRSGKQCVLLDKLIEACIADVAVCSTAQ